MNILPIVLALILMLSVMTIERIEKFKNQTLVQTEYEKLMRSSEGKEFNIREEGLFLIPRNIHRQLSFRSILNKEQRDKDENISKQYRQIAIDLVKILYQDANFYKKMESENPKFVEEMFDQIQEAADKAPKDSIKRIEDISRLQLKDPQIQEAFYQMLKGTIQRDKLKEIIRNKKNLSPQEKGKAYVSLLTYIHYNNTIPEIQLAPRELLEAIFENKEVVDEILVRRNELAKEGDSKGEENFRNEFNSKRKTGLSDQLLNFKISKSNKTKYD